jgi:hypothetical protein
MIPRDLYRLLFALCSIALLGIGATACGSTSAGTTHAPSNSQATTYSTASVPALPPDRDDNDGDNPENTQTDSDDGSVLDFGHPADASDARQITALVKRYYAAAAAEEGARACSMLYSTFAEAVPEDYGKSPPGPSFARGTTCPAVMTAMFKHFHSHLVARLPKLQVYRVGVNERQGEVVLRFGSLPEREIHVDREGHTWKVVALIDSALP